MATLALVGQMQFGNTRKIGTNLEAHGWKVAFIDSSKPQQALSGTKEPDLLLMVVSHMPNGLTQKMKDHCRKAGVRFLEIAPSWSASEQLLRKYGLLDPPPPGGAFAKDIVPVAPMRIVKSDVTRRPDKPLVYSPFKNLKEKLSAEAAPSQPKVEEKPMPAAEAKAATVEVTASSPEPTKSSTDKALQAALAAKHAAQLKKMETAQALFEQSPHATQEEIQALIVRKHGSGLDWRKMKDVRVAVWAKLGIKGDATKVSRAKVKHPRWKLHERVDKLLTDDITLDFRAVNNVLKEEFDGMQVGREIFDRALAKARETREKLAPPKPEKAPVSTTTPAKGGDLKTEMEGLKDIVGDLMKRRSLTRLEAYFDDQGKLILKAKVYRPEDVEF